MKKCFFYNNLRLCTLSVAAAIWFGVIVVQSEQPLCSVVDDEECRSFVPEWKWNPDSIHPCNIEKLTVSQLYTKFGPMGVPSLYPQPLVIMGSRKQHYNQEITRRTSIDNITKAFPPNFNVTLSSSNSFSARRRIVSLETYLKEVLTTKTTPNDMANETWYLFGETHTEEWKQFLNSYQLPPCQSCQVPDSVALSFGIGNQGSGAQWHIHGPGFSDVIWGKKHWILKKERPNNYDANQTSIHWMEYHYYYPQPNLYECTLDPGDMIYFPDKWFHAIVNLDRYNVFISSFTTEHL